jgi:hypothetical protein
MDQLLIVVISTALPLLEGFDALALGAFSALGLRTSLFDFFWLLAMAAVPYRADALAERYTLRTRYARIIAAGGGAGSSADRADGGVLAEDEEGGRREGRETDHEGASHFTVFLWVCVPVQTTGTTGTAALTISAVNSSAPKNESARFWTL